MRESTCPCIPTTLGNSVTQAGSLVEIDAHKRGRSWLPQSETVAKVFSWTVPQGELPLIFGGRLKLRNGINRTGVFTLSRSQKKRIGTNHQGFIRFFQV